MADKTLTCKDCGGEFVFSEGEQAFYKEKALRMNHKDVRIAGKPAKTKGEAIQASIPVTGHPTRTWEAADGKRLPSLN